MGRCGKRGEIGACAGSIWGGGGGNSRKGGKGRGAGTRQDRGAPTGPAGKRACESSGQPRERRNGATEVQRPRKDPPQGGSVAAEVERAERTTEVSERVASSEARSRPISPQRNTTARPRARRRAPRRTRATERGAAACMNRPGVSPGARQSAVKLNPRSYRGVLISDRHSIRPGA